MKKNIVVISVKKPSNFGGAEIIWENMKKQGLRFKNISLQSEELPFFFRFIPNFLHLKEIFASRWLLEQSLKTKPKKIIYDKIFGWPRIKSNIEKICYNHGSYTLAGLNFKKKNYLVYLFYKYIIRYFEKKSYIHADKIIAVSESVKKEMIDYFGISKEKIIVINNGIDLKKFKQIKDKMKLRRKYKLPLNKKIIFFPGRASFGKGFDIVEKVLTELGDDYFMVILGKGRSKLENIKFLEKIQNEKMPEIYNLSNLTLFPSRYEGNSVSVLESAACGVPLILSNVGEMKTSEEMKDFVCDSVEDYVRKIKNLNYESASKKWLNFSKRFPLKKQVKELNNLLTK